VEEHNELARARIRFVTGCHDSIRIEDRPVLPAAVRWPRGDDLLRMCAFEFTNIFLK
jgi:hypothetical protein